MNWLDSRDEKEKKAAFKNTVAVAFADGRLDDKETEALRFLATRMGLSTSQIESVLNNPDAIEFVSPADPKDRVLQIIDMVAVMMVDGEMANAEMTLCIHIGQKLGFSLEEVEHLIEGVVEAIRNGLNPLEA